MKYGVLTYKPEFGYLKNHLYNIGDNIQSIAIRSLYKNMGIQDDQIVEINKYSLNDYEGPYLLLPMSNFCALDTPGMFPLSQKIIPVYISFHLANKEVPECYVAHFKKYEPIGCRDRYTLENMRAHGIEAYLSGCITATLSKRSNNKRHRIFFVDTPDSLEPYIPDEIKDKVEYLSHVDHYKNIPLLEEELADIQTTAENRLELYREEAALVVTSRLHCASPCIAMGIPTIMVHNLYHYTFMAVDRFVPVYVKDNFSEIDWNPKSVNYEEIKKKIYQLFIDRIRSVYNQYKDFVMVTEFYGDQKIDLKENGYSSLVRNAVGENKIKCAIWGANMHATAVMESLEKEYLHYEIVDIIDEYKEGTFHGYRLRKSTCVNEHSDNVVYFIAAQAAFDQAEKLLVPMGRKVIFIK